VEVYKKELRNHAWKLKEFMIRNRKAIDLERTKIMLTTPKETLIAITEKEEMEFKMQQV